MPETVYKLQPNRTIYMRGVDRNGAAGAICNASATGFSAYTVFRDMADFVVIVVYDADNVFEHNSIKYLPDFSLSGLVLSYSYASTGVQQIDSGKYPWIDWSQLDYITSAGEPGKVRLWEHATLDASTPVAYSVASDTLTIYSNGCSAYDRITLWLDNMAFDFIAAGGETAASVVSNLAYQINTLNWVSANPSVAVIASIESLPTGEANTVLRLKYARFGTVSVSGTTVTWISGEVFTGIATGSVIQIGGFAYTVSSVNGPKSLTVASAPGNTSSTFYLAERGGSDGNMCNVLVQVRPDNVSLNTGGKTAVSLAGGVSDGVLWDVSIDFTSLGIDSLRQAWLTLAPALANGAAYADTEGSATWSSWAVSDPNNIRTLKVAGQNSIIVGNRDPRVTYAGTWTEGAANNYYLGYARASNNTGDSVTVSYICQETHDLWIGSELYKDRGIVNVSLDGDTATPLDLFVYAEPGIMSRRKIRSGVASGAHTLTITLTGTNHTATAAWDYNSVGYYFLFDYVQAIVASDYPDALPANAGVTAAIDGDTDATYKQPPERVLWAMQKLSFMGRVNHYWGVFFGYQRTRTGGVWQSATVTFGGTWAGGDAAFIDIGGFTFGKTVFRDAGDTDAQALVTIAQHFVYYINQTSVEMRATVTGAGQLTIYVRTPVWGDTLSVSQASSAGTITASGSLGTGTEGTWTIDDTAANPINWPTRQWLADLYSTAQGMGLNVTTAISMELVNPPDDPGAGKVYAARFADGTVVTTDTGYQSLYSTQCALGSSTVLAFQKSVLASLAALQTAAGLPVWLQFGEFLWWYFSSKKLNIGYASYTSPISIGTVDGSGNPLAHGFSTGDRVVQAGVGGNTAANGTFTIAVTDPYHYTLNGTSGNGTYTSGGAVSGGSMAYYDADTTAAASAALGRSLVTFTCQDDDPTVNSGADASFLAARLASHIDTLKTYILGLYSGASFELLWPDDVNYLPCYYTNQYPYPQGGRLNRAVNYPPSWTSPSTSGLAFLKVEALSWGATYRNLDNSKAALTFSSTNGLSWPPSSVGYLVPIYNGGCPWKAEYFAALQAQVSLVVLWAWDHIGLMTWPLPLPTPSASTKIF